MADVVVDAKPMEKLPYDPSTIPEAVRKRAAAVDALYKSESDAGQQAATPSSDMPETPPPEAPPAPQVPAPPVLSSPTPAQAAPAESPPAEDDNSPEAWRRRYLRMQGQYNAATKLNGELQEQMVQLGNELLHTQRVTQQPARQTEQPPPPPDFLTEQDVQNYGSDLVDLTQRAALHAVAPHLQNLEQQNAELQKRLAKEARRVLDQAVEMALPNYREIDRDPRWHRWLLGVDMLSGRVRQQLLNEAISAASAPRVLSFFNSFLREEAATGHVEPASSSSQPAAPREATLNLASLAAPGRGRPATGGDASLPTDKPVYTRAQIRDLYSAHRKGAYNGREAEWNRIDADIIAAGREGRVRI